MATNQSIPQEFLDLFQKPILAHLATLMPDGSPQVTPVWVDYDGKYVLINTEKGRQKDNTMRARPQVALDMVDPTNPFRFLSIRGRVAEVTENGAADHIDRMAKKYLGADQYPNHNPNSPRQLY